MPSLPPSEFDNPLGEGTGAAVLFGATGGVMEAALRTAYELCTGACPQPACLPAFLPARQLAILCHSSHQMSCACSGACS